MIHNYMFNEVVGNIKITITTENFDNTEILIDTDDKLLVIKCDITFLCYRRGR